MRTKIRIYDEWLARTFEPQRGARLAKDMLEMREQLLPARIFEPDVEAIRYMVDQSIAQPRELLPLLQLARLPFQTTWIEDDTAARLRRCFERGTLSTRFEPDEMFHTSFLLRRLSETRWECAIMPSFRDRAGGGFLNFAYVIDTENYPRDPVDDATLQRWFGDKVPKQANEYLAALAVGYHSSQNRIDDAKAVLRHVRVVVLEAQSPSSNDETFEAMREVGGSLRYVLSFLATINLVETRFTPQDKKLDRLMVGRRSIPYMASTTVSIKVPSKPLHKLARKAVAGWKNRAHEVRGHWRKHLDRESGEFVLKWVKEHTRGDAALGFCQHKYHVEGTAHAKS
jgi:hypothetical protein